MNNPMMQAMRGPMAPMGNMMQMVQQFNQFRQSFRGDPKAEVERLVNEGKVTPEQLEQFKSQAQQISQFLR